MAWLPEYSSAMGPGYSAARNSGMTGLFGASIAPSRQSGLAADLRGSLLT